LRGDADSYNTNATNTSTIIAVLGQATQRATSGTAATVYGGSFSARNYGDGAGNAGTVTTAAAVHATNTVLTGGTITNAYGVKVGDLTNSGTVTNTYGAYVGDITTGTQTNTPFSFYASDASTYNYFAGNVGIGTTVPENISGNAGFLAVAPSTYTVPVNNANAILVTGTYNATMSNALGINIVPTLAPYSGGGGSASAWGMYVKPTVSIATSLTANAVYGIGVDAIAKTGAGTVTNAYGIYVSAPTAGTTNYSLYVASGDSYFAGKVGIGTTAPGAPLEVKGTGTGATIAKFTDVNTTGCTLATGGTIACSSDERLKKNIEDISYGLTDLMKLRPVLFNWNSETDGIDRSLGFIAQDVEKIIPKLIATDDQGMKSLNTIGLVPVLTKSIQEQQIQIQGLISKYSTTGQTTINDPLAATTEVANNTNDVSSLFLVGEVAGAAISKTPADAPVLVAANIDLNILGTMTIKGAVSFNGNAEFKNKTLFNALVRFAKQAEFADKVSFNGDAEFAKAVKFMGDVTFDGRPTFNKDTAGRAIIKKGNKKVEVKYALEYAVVPVVNATIAAEKSADDMLSGGYAFAIADQTTKGFTIILGKKAGTDVSFAWAALAVKDMQTTISPDAPVEAPVTPPTEQPTALPTEQPAPTEQPTVTPVVEAPVTPPTEQPVS
jgi:hypothetical protein